MGPPDPLDPVAPTRPVGLGQPNAARMYDFLLGGTQNFAADRRAAEMVIAANPGTVTAARANRAFLRRVVVWCLEHGIDQFLDLGSGVPTVGNVHEVALHAEPRARVAYVEIEPVAVAHTAEILSGVDQATITHADIREPASVLAAGGVAGLLDFSRPVAVLATAILHFLPGDLAGMATGYRRALAPGSVVAISHASDDTDDAEVGEAMRAGCETYRMSTTPMTLRSRAELRALLDGLELVEPGLVDVTDWPVAASPPHPVGGYGAVAVVRS